MRLASMPAPTSAADRPCPGAFASVRSALPVAPARPMRFARRQRREGSVPLDQRADERRLLADLLDRLCQELDLLLDGIEAGGLDVGRIATAADGSRRTAGELLAMPGVSLARLGRIWPELAATEPEIAEQLEIDARYAGYLDRQAADIAAFRRDESLALPQGLDYDRIGSLSNEVRARLTAARPATLGQAARMEGVTPGALTALLAHVRRTPKGPAHERA